jgi:hypothetical protein
VVIISLSEQISVNSNLTQNLWNNFKSMENWKEVSITKSVPNSIYYLLEFSMIFPRFLSIFLRWKTDVGFI